MPIVYSVNDITNILSTIIQTEPALQKVRVQGRVSVDGPKNVFFLYHAGEKIRCFIPNNKVAIFSPLLEAGNTMMVKGNIRIFPAFSEYQIRVEDVQHLEVTAFGDSQPFTVSEITRILSDMIKNSSKLTEIHVRGEISESARQSGATFWFLIDTDIVNSQRIHCVCFETDGVAVGNGDQVRIEGNIQIWGAQSRYQINITHIKPDDNTEQCQCSGCVQCTGAIQCNRTREIANFESCATCLPHPPDELYELCPECYAVSPDHETKVAEAVYTYFNELQVNGFSPDKECQIQFGTRNGSTDVVLADGNGSFAVISECKGAGYVGHGIEQLKSYLSATDTRFGIFANRADDSRWEFYENRRQSQIDQIDRSEFEMGVVNGITTRERLKDEIRHLNSKITELGSQRCELDAAINQITQTKHNLTKRTSNLTCQIEALENYKSELHEEIHRKLDHLLEEKMQRLESPLSDLKIELQKRGIVNWFKNLFSKENK